MKAMFPIENTVELWYNVDRHYTRPNGHELTVIAQQLWYNIDRYYTRPNRHELTIIPEQLWYDK